jgi:hypothetical protein
MFTCIDAINPEYEFLQVRCKVTLRETRSEGYYLRKLNTEINNYIAFWEADNEAPVFGHSVSIIELANFIRSREYITRIENYSLVHLREEHEYHYKLEEFEEYEDSNRNKANLKSSIRILLNDKEIKLEEVKPIKPSKPWAILIPINKHMLVAKGELQNENAGINELEIGNTFVIKLVMARRNRLTLKKYFGRGKMPTEEHFIDLVDSMLNIVDEGFDKSSNKGLSLAPLNEEGSVASVFRKIEDEEQKWTLSLEKDSENLIFKQVDGDAVITLNQNGNTGFGTNEPKHQIHTTGVAGLYGRAGTYAEGEIAANGKWQNITDELLGCHAFEVIAGSGKPREGKYALLVATAIQCFGAHCKVDIKQSWYGIRCNKIQLRWKRVNRKANKNVVLQMKTRCNYGPDSTINFNISSLWDNNKMTKVRTDSIFNE